MAIGAARRTDSRTREVERRVCLAEDREAWARVRLLGNVIHLAVVADRPDIADHSAGELVMLASRRLRQLGGADVG